VPPRHDVARAARRARTPADLGVRAAPRLRPPAVPGRAFPTRPRPEAPGSPPGVPRRYLRRPLSSPRSRAAPINTPHFPSSAGIATPPRNPRRRHRAAPLPAFRGQATVPIPSLEPIEPSHTTCCPGRAHAIAGTEPPWPPPSVPTARPRRCVLRPNSGHPLAIGEPKVVPRRFPGRERGRLAGIWPAPPPPMAKGYIARPELFIGCFV
jgi:hypothetical protein